MPPPLNLMLAKIIGLFLVIIPWMIFPRPDVYDQTRMIKSVFFDLACITVILYSLYYGVISRYRNKILSIFALYVFIIQFFNWYKPMICSYNKMMIMNISTIEPFLHFILALSATFMACSSLNKDDFKIIGKFLAWSVVAVVGYIILQKFNIDPWGQVYVGNDKFLSAIQYKAGNHCVAMLDNPNLSGGYIGLCIPFLLALRKWWAYTFAGISFVVAVWAGSMGGIIVSIIGTLIYFLLTNWKNERLTYKIICGTLVGLTLSGIIYLITSFGWDSDIGENSWNGRIRIFQQSWEYFKINPLWGKGLGVFPTYQIKLGQLWAKEAHCDWYERMFEIGIIGTAMLFLVVVNSIKKFSFDKSNRNAIAFFSSFICFLVLMVLGFPIENGALALTGLVTFWAVETL